MVPPIRTTGFALLILLAMKLEIDRWIQHHASGKSHSGLPRFAAPTLIETGRMDFGRGDLPTATNTKGCSMQTRGRGSQPRQKSFLARYEPRFADAAQRQIIGYSEVCSSGDSIPVRLRTSGLKKIKRPVKHLLSLIMTFLTFSKIEPESWAVT